MKITNAELIEMVACDDGAACLIMQTGNTNEPVEIASLVGGENTYEDLLWLASKKLPEERIVRFARDCALINVELIEPYTDEYDSIVEFLRNPTWSNAERVVHTIDHADAGYADYEDVGYAAGYAVYAAACAAMSTDVYATYAHTADASLAAAYAGGNEKVNELLKELFA